MLTLTRSLLLLASALAFAPACDEPFDEAYADDGDISLRCIGAGCTLGGLGNTSKIGDHALSNMSETIGQGVANMSASVKIISGVAYYNGNPGFINQIEVDPDGELRLRVDTMWIQGVAVKNAYFNLVITPNDVNEPAFLGRLLIADAKCEPGKYVQAMSICRYEFVTNVVPEDTNEYPMHDKFFGWYHTCPNEDEQGTLPAGVKYSSVLSPNVTLFQSPSSQPRIDVNSGKFINGCINGAVSKGQYQLNTFYDSTAFRGLHPAQRTTMLLMWMAWFNGKTRTVPGQQISPHDPMQGLFTWTADPAWDVEAGYRATGAVCRGGDPDLGLHRYVVDPVLNLVGWAGLQYCNAANIASLAAIGVKVQSE